MDANNTKSESGLFNHSRMVCEGLYRLQQNRTFCDITIKVGDKSFDAHKAVLASNSDFFHVMFTSGFQESHGAEASITGKPKAFKILLDFSYSGKLNIIPSEISTNMDVLTLAHYLQYNQAVVECQDLLLRNFHRCNMKEALQIMSESDILELPRLKVRGQQYLAQNFDGSDDFLQLMTSDLIVETMGRKDFNVIDRDEKKVFDIIVAWLKHDWEARKEFASSLFQKLRLGAIPSGHLTVTFLESPELNSIPECRQMVVKVMQLLDSKKPNSLPLSISHPGLFETRSTVTNAVINVDHGTFFDNNVKTWRKLSKYPELPKVNSYYEATFNNCVVANHQLYVARVSGHQGVKFGPSNFVSLDVVNKKWKTLAPMTQRKGTCCLVQLDDNHIYAIGGVSGYKVGVGGDEDYMNKCEVYSIKEDAWTEITPMPYPVYKMWPNSAVVYNGKILVYAGTGIGKPGNGGNGNRILNCNLMMYNPTNKRWCHC